MIYNLRAICNQIHFNKGEGLEMNDLEYNPFSKKEYYDMCGVNTEEKLHFYYDESNNCRKFWLDSTKNSFNHNFLEDFVLAGIASESNSQIPFDELKQRFGLQKNAVELKSKSMFRGKDFLQCIGTKQAPSRRLSTRTPRRCTLSPWATRTPT